MRVALFVPGGVDRSGVDRVTPWTAWLVERVARRHDVHVFVAGQEIAAGEWDFFGARVHDVGVGRGRLRRLLHCFGGEHRSSPFDLIHAFFGWPAFHAAIIGRRYRLPVLFHAAGGEFVDFRDIGYGMRSTWRGRLSLRVTLACASGVSVASESMR